ncbi:response regulator [bacterium]|nr:response regulator [bacterium]
MKKRILFVDDEVSILEMLRMAFEQFGYEVYTADSGMQAVELLKSVKVDCMFFDLRLPGMDGIELCRIIRRDNPIAAIFAMTGYANVFELFDCREAGFDDYFLKPLDLQAILGTVEAAYERLERWKLKRPEATSVAQ